MNRQELRDLTLDKEIHVTERDMDLGISCNCSDCPVALAVKRRFPSLSAHVYSNEYEYYLYLFHPSTPAAQLRYRLSNEVEDFIYEYDEMHWGLDTEPLEIIRSNAITVLSFRLDDPMA